MSEYNDGLTDEQKKEQARADLLARIADLQALIAKLEDYKEQLSEQEELTRSEVLTPESEYDLTVASDIKHWAGVLETDGESKQGDIALALDGFCSDIQSVISVIDDIIRQIQEEIDGLMADLAALG